MVNRLERQFSSDSNKGCSGLFLSDARFLALAFIRLPAKEYNEYISRIVGVLESACSNVYDTNSELSGFVARLVTFLSAMIEIVGQGMGEAESLVMSIGNNMCNLPVIPTNTAKNLWYKEEKCFIEIFPKLSNTSINEFNDGLSSEIKIKLKSVCEKIMDLGFRSSANDNCHLLYAAWNILGKIRWSCPPSVWNGWSFYKHKKGISGLVSLRDDIILFHDFLHKQSALSDKSNEIQTGTLIDRIGETLQKGLEHTEKLLAHNFNVYINDLSPKDFAFLESLFLFINYLTAVHTFDSECIFNISYHDDVQRYAKVV